MYPWCQGHSPLPATSCKVRPLGIPFKRKRRALTWWMTFRFNIGGFWGHQLIVFRGRWRFLQDMAQLCVKAKDPAKMKDQEDTIFLHHRFGSSSLVLQSCSQCAPCYNSTVNPTKKPLAASLRVDLHVRFVLEDPASPRAGYPQASLVVEP